MIMNILVVDDEQAAIRDIVRILKRVVPDAVIKKTDEADIALAMCRLNSFDVAFLDVNMPEKDGIVLAKEMKELNPLINIIMLTAYPQFAVDAFKLYASGYLLKPAVESDVKSALSNLRNPVSTMEKGLFIRCFGDFEVFYDGVPLKFGRSKSKELLAFLVDKHGDTATNAEIRMALWGDELEVDKQKKYLTQIVFDLKNALGGVGCADILIQSRDAYSVATTGYKCDYFAALSKDPEAMSNYSGAYMERYHWARL